MTNRMYLEKSSLDNTKLIEKSLELEKSAESWNAIRYHETAVAFS